MTKQSTITNLIVMPLIASAVFLASPAFAASTSVTAHKEVRNITTKGPATNTKKGIVGTVTSINGTIILVTSKDNIQYTVDATSATIMKEGVAPNTNPTLVQITDIKVGDSIVVRGVIKDTEVNANNIFDGKMPSNRPKNAKGLKKMSAKMLLKHS
jgi:preprotein translocase subunit YajC